SSSTLGLVYFFFFFQAEDGIRDFHVTRVQTCALPICPIRGYTGPSTRRVDGPVYPRIGLVETIEAAQQHEHYNTPLEGPNRGREIGRASCRERGWIAGRAGGVKGKARGRQAGDEGRTY